MRCPTKEQILQAAKRSTFVREALTDLFPEVFERPIHKGELYEWGTDSDGESGLVVEIGSKFMLVNFHTGDVYLGSIPRGSTRNDLNYMLSCLSPGKLHSCYDGDIRGPKHFKSWCTK